ncbi:hypothetical protein [Nonomuraea sp. NPDC049028]|uniref:hypothetical protein n=1 Tax=Nonomuraea sp. NPDC049028 TaxID=3364348 RepID=UPI003723814E
MKYADDYRGARRSLRVYELGGPQSRFRGKQAGYSPGHALIRASGPPIAGESP